MITTGVSGRPWRASITPWGAVQPWDDQPTLDWFVAAEDRWHVPADEPSLRQRRVSGTAVVETRVRVPSGDVIQRIASMADGPGYTVIEIENDSTAAVAVAFSHRDVRTERPIVDLPIEGLDLPDDAFVLPIGHRSTVRVAIAHDRSGDGQLPALPAIAQVVSGWLTVTDRASRFVLPEGETGEAVALDVTARRCELALGEMAHGETDPAGYAIGLGELVRMGERPDPWLPELALAVERLARTDGWMADAAFDAAARVLHVAGEHRALADLGRLVERRSVRAERPVARVDGVGLVPWLEQGLADRGRLLPDGIPTAWLGANFEVYGVPVGPASTISYAVRWHGERPAVLWEVTGPPVELTSPSLDPVWRTHEPTGETLWPPPAPLPTTDPGSFT
ncbi:MAG: hypothetical protein EA389_10350 [Ilumatobacter sp.]|nr:MAG: hypothetical protein EA389_10350 [Ilumatobacter sp.]